MKKLTIDELTNRSILRNQDQLVNFVFINTDMGDDRAPFSREDICNQYEPREIDCPLGSTWEITPENQDEKANDAENMGLDILDDEELHDKWMQFADEIRDMTDFDDREIFTWYLVSDHFGWFIEEHTNYPYMKTDVGFFWGRTTFGQLIASDYVMEQYHKYYMKNCNF